jgi:hypothetical protein
MKRRKRTLDHKILDDAVKLGALVASFSAGAELEKVLTGLGVGVEEELHLHAARGAVCAFGQFR